MRPDFGGPKVGLSRKKKQAAQMHCGRQEHGAFKEPQTGPGSHSKGRMWLKLVRTRPPPAAIVRNQVFSAGARSGAGDFSAEVRQAHDTIRSAPRREGSVTSRDQGRICMHLGEELEQGAGGGGRGGERSELRDI